MTAAELATTRQAKLDMVTTLQDTWSGRAAERGTKVAPTSPSKSSSANSPRAAAAALTGGLREVWHLCCTEVLSTHEL